MLTWDVSNGVARRSWAGNANAKLAIESEMRRQDVSLAGSRCCHSPHPVKHIFAAAEQASLLLLKLLAAAEGAFSAFSCQGLVVTVPEQADPSLVATYVGDDAVALDADGAKGQTTEKAVEGGGRPTPPPSPVVTATALRLLLINCSVATMAAPAEGKVARKAEGMAEVFSYGLIEDGAVGVAPDGTIALVCALSDLPAGAAALALEVRDMNGGLVTPGLIDCHTHLVYSGASARVREWELKLGGASYEEIAKAGGGIAATVEGTRSASIQVSLPTPSP